MTVRVFRLLSLVRSRLRRSLAWLRSGASFRPAVICWAFYLPFIRILYGYAIIYRLTVCGRSVGVLWLTVGALSVLSSYRWSTLDALSPLPSFLESGRNCRAVIPSPTYPMDVGAVVLLWRCVCSFCGLLLGRC